VVHAQRGGHARLEVGQHHIGLGDQPVRQRAALVGAQIDAMERLLRWPAA
jgi:hypothetical protein